MRKLLKYLCIVCPNIITKINNLNEHISLELKKLMPGKQKKQRVSFRQFRKNKK